MLRESRGDGHVAALVAADLDPCEALVLFAADRALDPALLRLARGWSPQEWADAEDRLAERGLLEHEPAEPEPVTGYARPAVEPAEREQGAGEWGAAEQEQGAGEWGAGEQEHQALSGNTPNPPAEPADRPTTPTPERRVVLTTAGIALREQVERVTDAVAERPWRVLGGARTTRLSDLLTPLALTIGARNEVMRDNPMAIDPVRDLPD